MASSLSKIAKYRDFLKERIDPETTLCFLLAEAILSKEEVDEVKSRSTIWEKNERLLDYIIEKDDEQELINVLRDANQKHLAYYLLNDGVRSRDILEDWPLEEKQILTIDVNYGCLKELIDMRGGLVDSLLAGRVISHRQQQLVCSKASDSEKTEVFLDTLRRGSIGDYENSIKCLRESIQGQIADILEKGSVSATYDRVSEFIVKTCRWFSKTNSNVLDSIHLQTSIAERDCSILSGSCAEFFIRPLHSCIGDVDVFKIKQNSLAFTDEKPVLPYDYRQIPDAKDCYFMEPYLDHPAFVRLRLLGQMWYDWECKTFKFVHDDGQIFLTTTEVYDGDIEGHCVVGPALKTLDTDPFSADFVSTIWCPQWPNEAKKWPNRHRKHGWPTTAIIHEVVQNGCHVVKAKHPACRNDVHQWRLSFSVAEVILLQSWTPIQQIVYHMVRFFSKRELIRKDCPKEDEVLCTYHFKTIMMWSCEEMSPGWWNSLSVIKICCILIEKLSKWLKETRCPNYFIPQANLFHGHFSQKVVDETAKKMIYYCDPDILSLWFMEHYMHPRFLDLSGEKCTLDILSHEYVMLIRQVIEAMDHRSFDRYVSIRFCFDVYYAHRSVEEGFDSLRVDIFKYTLRFGSPFEKEIDFLPSPGYESIYWFYGSMLRILYAAHLLDWEEMFCDSEWFAEIIGHISSKPKFFRSKHHNLPRPLCIGDNESQLFLVRAQDLMENLIESNDNLEFQVVSEISKELLSRALEVADSKTNVIVRATLCYEAALHFAASEYQIVLDICLAVIMNEKSEKEETETLNAGCLLYVEDIAKIIGFYLVFRRTKYASLHFTKRQFFLDLRLTPEVFAQYLRISSIERTGEAFEPNNISQTPIFPLDAILMTIINEKISRCSMKRRNVLCCCQRTDQMNKLKVCNEICLPSEYSIVQLLMEYSLENMRAFYDAICETFAIDCSTVDCYRAAYLKKCHKYSEVLPLCERILDQPDLESHLKELAFVNVIVLPPLDIYFDNNIQCLLGLHTLVCYLSPSNKVLDEIEVSEISTFQNHFARHIYSGKKSLSAVLTDPSNLKSRYFLGRHFLARYLKVGCLIECSHSLSEVMFEFKKLKACLPFEHVIRLFLEQKLSNFRQLFLPNTVQSKV